MSGYVHSGINPMIKVEAYKHENKLLVANKYGNAKVSTLTETTVQNAINDINRIKYAVNYKGEKTTVDALPTTGNTQGDMWNVTENGHNYSWTGTEWDDLGGTAVGGGNSDWEWDPIPIYEETLTDGFYYDPEEGDPYSLPTSLFTPALKAILVYIYGGSLANSYNHSCNILFNSDVSLPGSVNTATSVTLDIKLPIKQTVNAGDTRYSLAVEAIPYHNQYIVMGGRDLAFVRHVYESTPDAPPSTLYFLPPKDSLGITGFSLFSSIPSGAKVTVYGPKTNN